MPASRLRRAFPRRWSAPWRWPRPSGRAGSARSSSPRGEAPATSASSAAGTARRRATPPMWSPTMASSRARRAVPRLPSRPRSPRVIEQAFTTARDMVKDDKGETAEVKFSRVPAYPPFRLPEERRSASARPRRSSALGIDAELHLLQRRPGRQLARQARGADDHHRRRPGRDPHHQGICRPQGVRAGVPAGDPARNARRLARFQQRWQRSFIRIA